MADLASDDGGGSEMLARLSLHDKARDGAARRGTGRGGRGGGAQPRHVKVSRALSRLLRHQADSTGIELDGEGFAPLDQVLAWGPLRSLDVTLSDVQSIVATNDKQRFCLKPNPTTDADSASAYLIRANQGHSIKLASSALLEPVTLADGNVPPRVVHGTYFALWPAIEASGGLRPMRRTHVHCAAGVPDEDGGDVVVSGMRADAELVVEIDVAASLREGLAWWRSDNGVLLTEGGEQGVVSTRFFKRVTGRRLDVGVLCEDGVKKADLPEGIRGRVPPGKGSRGGGGGGSGRRGRGRQRGAGIPSPSSQPSS